MKSHVATFLAIAATASALPATTDPKPDPYPRISIESLNGPACPTENPGDGFTTRLSYGLVDDTQYYRHVAYPNMWAGVNVPNADATRWCETTLKVRLNDKKRLLIHETGTRMLATYNLDEGTKAQWKFTYYVPGGEELVDTINVKGPVHTGNHEIPLNSTLAPGTKPYNFTQCGGEVTVKYRTDLTVTEDVKGAVGEVNSMKAYYEHEYYNGTYYFGVEQGVSFGWDDCTN